MLQFESFRQSTAYQLHVLVRLLDKAADKIILRYSDLTYSQFLILVHLQQGEQKISQKALAMILQVTEAAISRQVEVLRQKSYLTRLPEKSDRRKHVIKITVEGQKVLQKLLELLQIKQKEIFATLSGLQLASFNQTIQQIISILYARR